jgi:hypothetical protein
VIDYRDQLMEIMNDPARRCVDRLAAARCIVEQHSDLHAVEAWRLVSGAISIFFVGVLIGAAVMRVFVLL